MDFLEYVSKHRGKIAGIILGLLFGWLVIKYGLWKAFFIAFCVGAGYYIGKRLDEQVDFKDMLSRFFRKD